jgi:hypothetical protein
VALSRVRRLSDLMLFGTDEFPKNGPDFHLNRFVEELDHAFEEPHEFWLTQRILDSMTILFLFLFGLEIAELLLVRDNR